jgi:hypothetical protein
MFSWRKQAALYFRLLAPASTTFCSQYSDVFLLLCAWSALARKFSGLAHALKLVNIEASSNWTIHCRCPLIAREGNRIWISWAKGDASVQFFPM